MTSNKLTNVLQIISDNFIKNQIPFCLIGAMALGLYGHPRFTADIDLLTEDNCWLKVSSIMKKLGYTCYQKTDFFAQFDSELKIFPNVDFMIVSTQDGKDIIKRSIIIQDEIFPKVPMIQPTDYIILKLMAIANNPERSIKDEADISTIIELYKKKQITDKFETLDKERILYFADKFDQRLLIDKYLNYIGTDNTGTFKL